MELLDNKHEFETGGLEAITNAIAFASKMADLKHEPKPDNTSDNSIFDNLSNQLYLTGTRLGMNDGYLAQ